LGLIKRLGPDWCPATIIGLKALPAGRLALYEETRHYVGSAWLATQPRLSPIGGKRPSEIVQERLGHHSIAVTLDTYSHLMPNMQADATAKIDAAFRAAKKSK
jgi:hypothetical protein